MIKSQRRLVAALHTFTLLLLALHLYVRTLPPTPTPIPEPTDAEAAWWGLWPVTYAPGWGVVLGALVVVGIIALFWGKEIGDWRLEISTNAGQEQNSATIANLRVRNTRPLFLILSACLFLAFFLFPVVHTRWGDAYMLAKGIAFPDPALRTVYSWKAPFDVFLHSQMWRWFGARLEAVDDATAIYRLLSPLAGAIYLAFVLAISFDRRIAPAWLSFGLLTSLGLLQLFFGYIENYSFVAAGILGYLWLGIAVLRGEKPLWLAASMLALTNAFHPSTVVLAPSLLYLGWQTKGQGQWLTRRQFLDVSLQIVVPMVVVAGATLLLMEIGGHGLQTLFTSDQLGGDDGKWFVPLRTISTQREHYTMFSWLHLRDLLNGQMLVAPAVGGAILIGLIYWRLEIRRLGDWEIGLTQNLLISQSLNLQLFLSIATLSYLLLIFIWNPDYGGQRDWDLFSLATIPMTLWLILALPRWLKKHYLHMAMIPLLALQIFHTAAWIYQNTLPWEWPK